MVALRSLVSIIVTPFAECFTEKTSSEITILIGLITSALGFFVLASTVLIEDLGSFMGFSIGSVCFLGVSTTFGIIGEQCLLLRYSKKIEREKTSGMFRLSSTVGLMVSPVFCSATVAIGGVFLCYATFGLGFLLLAPLTFCKLRSAREIWIIENLEQDLIK